MATQAGPKKCGNAACTCTVPDSKSKYCSAHCEGMGQRVELMCTCGHAHCGATVSVFPPIEPDQPQAPRQIH
jgi:hypothetical protein